MLGKYVQCPGKLGHTMRTQGLQVWQAGSRRELRIPKRWRPGSRKRGIAAQAFQERNGGWTATAFAYFCFKSEGFSDLTWIYLSPLPSFNPVGFPSFNHLLQHWTPTCAHPSQLPAAHTAQPKVFNNFPLCKNPLEFTQGTRAWGLRCKEGVANKTTCSFFAAGHTART